jgi:cell division protein FtsI (penicillin-binding protein 3)
MGVLGLLAARAISLAIWNKEFLQGQGEARAQRILTIPADRGMVTDRHGEPLAISTPVASLWANPQTLLAERASWGPLTRLLGLKTEQFEGLLDKHKQGEFLYLKRHLAPEVADQVAALKISGVFLQQEYRRFYPAAEVTSHIIGFTNIDDAGQEGLELAYERQLRGEPGSQQVIRDRNGTVVEGLRRVRDPRPGRQLTLSLDMRLQYLAYRELKAAVLRHKAQAGSLIMLDVNTGEVLAMVNQPAYNPNNRHRVSGAQYRNRAVTDLFEPGSSIKPFTIAAALESGRYRPDTRVDTRPGTFRVAGKTIRDVHPYGLIDVATVIKKSSNVGTARIALSLPPERLWGILVRMGFGGTTGSGFPGESRGVLREFQRWRTLDHAILSFGYGLSVTPLQLARAYAVLAAGGKRREVSFLSMDDALPGDVLPGKQVMAPETAAQVLTMLEGVVQEGGTGTRARVPGYRVAGKTGTVHKLGPQGYQNDYIAVFAGIAPVSHPRVVMVVTIDRPATGKYFGGEVAAPVFGRVMEETLRLLDVPPDDPTLQQVQMAWQVDPL